MARLNFFNFTFVLLLIDASSANFCTDDTGLWISSIAQGVTDYAYGGSRLNTNYYCFEGCLNTGTALQNYKVLLSGKNSSSVAVQRERPVKQIKVQLAAVRDDDPNLRWCVDPVLRADIAAALKKSTQPSCKNIVNTLVLNLNRPGWAITCIQLDSIDLDFVIADMNFCSYDALQHGDLYTIRLAKLDMS